MTREEAIEWMDWLKMDVRERGYNDIVAALNMAIQALEKEPCEDCVSREEVDKLIWEYLKEPTDNHVAFYEHFLDLPSVQPARIHAKWKDAVAYNYRCSECKRISPYDYAYCPHCGAQMEMNEE